MTSIPSTPVTLKITILVRIRPGILDPQGQAVCQALHDSGANEVGSVRIGKLIELTIEDKPFEDFSETAKKFCESLLVNPLTEEFEILSIVPAPVSASRPGSR
ncbi:MAG: phosphoribosylformylglycinamidine synthase subunit PurS [Leptospirillum sp.]|nr:phosphoribosylformylglycinamidine synthase subunit PurS [Nitrospiraceae bacterium]MDA8150811.1 phosphoribosylformylglycinamidine synthase subunit PurS [Nitrospiraceae bacterium]